MAKHEHRKEDLIADATALVDRAEFKHGDDPELLVAGFRKNGALSLYFGEDPVYHFNADGELRRAYFAEAIYKAEQAQLVRMQRNRTAAAHELISHVLDESEQREFLQALTQRLTSLHASRDAWDVTREVRVSAETVADRLYRWLDEQRPLRIADGPRV